MATRLIKYLPKQTAAGTEYREIADDDKQWILVTCIEVLTMMAEYDKTASQDQDRVWVRDQWWHKKDKRLAKGRDGLNTPCSTLGGVVNNLMFKVPLQRDLSDKQMQDIEFILQCCSSFRDEITPVRFQIGFA